MRGGSRVGEDRAQPDRARTVGGRPDYTRSRARCRPPDATAATYVVPAATRSAATRASVVRAGTPMSHEAKRSMPSSSGVLGR